MVQIPRHGLFLIALPFVHGLIIPADLGDIKFNDYGLSEAQTLAQAEWAATGIIPEWALSIYPLLQTENSLHHTNEDRPETEKHQEDGSGPINKRNNNIEGDDYHDVIPPIGNTFPNGEVFVPLPGLPGTMGTGLLKAADEMEEGTVDARGAQEGQTLGGEICDGGSDDTISRRDIVGEEEMYAHNQVLQTPAGQVYLEPHTLARRETNSGQAPSIVAERPTVIDWWTIGGPQFLKAYMTDWAGTNFTEKHGVFGSLAGCYGLVKGDSKNPEDVCAQLRAALGEESVEHVSFVLTAVKNFVALSDLIYDSIEPAFNDAAKMIDALPYTNEWWKKYPNSKKTKFAAENIVAAVRDTILSEIPWRTTESLKQEIEKVNTNAVQSKAGAKIANIDTGSLSHSINKWDQLFGTNVDILTLDQARGSPGYKPLMGETNAEAMAAAEILIDYVAKMRTVVETEEFSGAADATWGVLKDFFKIVEDKAQFNRKAAQAVGKVSMQDYYGATAQLGQKALGEAVSGLLELDTPEKRMNMYKLLEYGNLLATDVEAIQEAREIFPTVLARRILQKALNEALTSDTTYIACTVSNSRKPYQFGTYQPGVSCDRDQSGPPDLKACVDGDACYLYRWKEYDKFNVINLFRHEHNDKPLGIGEWSTPPYFTNASDIIISSVRSALENLEDFRIKKDGQPLLSTEATSLSDIAKASTPGTFKVPVCYSDYNWNTPLKTTKKNKWWQVSCSRDDPYCHEHKLPCYCGPWGSQTQSVWKAMGIAGGFTQKQICGRNIASRVSNPLEHYVALCRLNIHRNLGILGSWINGWVVFKDADKNCDKVIGILENFKFGTFEEIPSDIKWVMYCKVLGTLGDETRCDAYNYLWDEITKPGAGLPKSTLDMETVREEVKIFESEFARLALENAEEDDLGDDDA